MTADPKHKPLSLEETDALMGAEPLEGMAPVSVDPISLAAMGVRMGARLAATRKDPRETKEEAMGANPNHAPGKTSPSNLALRKFCPGSARMEYMAAFPEAPEDSDVAKEGQRHHRLAESYLSVYISTGENTWGGRDIPRSVAAYCDFVVSMGSEAERWCLEWPVETPGVGRGRVDLMFLYRNREGEIRIAAFDFKSGWASNEVAWKYQMLPYALAAHKYFRDNEAVARQITEVDTYVVAPNTAAYVTKKTFDFSGGNRQKYIDIIEDIVAAANRPDAPTKAGPHCDACYCDARPVCEAYAHDQEGRLSGIIKAALPRSLDPASFLRRIGPNYLADMYQSLCAAKAGVKNFGPLIADEIVRRSQSDDCEDTPGLTVVPNIGNQRFEDCHAQKTCEHAFLARGLGGAWDAATQVKVTQPIPQTRDNAVEALVERAKERGEALTKKDARLQVDELLADHTVRPPVKGKPWKIVVAPPTIVDATPKWEPDVPGPEAAPKGLAKESEG